MSHAAAVNSRRPRLSVVAAQDGRILDVWKELLHQLQSVRSLGISQFGEANKHSGTHCGRPINEFAQVPELLRQSQGSWT